MQFRVEKKDTVYFGELPENLMLGKRVERFFSYQLKSQKRFTILKENIQIYNDKITIGELDCLLLENHKPKHVEVVYKFYLYDHSVGKTELEHLIGPNRKDTLTQKIEKLKLKQLPLLHKIETHEILTKMGYEAINFCLLYTSPSPRD